MSILFVGERRSDLAKKLKLRWENGGLAAKPLFEALAAAGINPQEHRFVNWFEGGKQITRTHSGPIVAMGRKVQRALTQEGIRHISIVHPAARGAIRERGTYVAHVKAALAAL